MRRGGFRLAGGDPFGEPIEVRAGHQEVVDPLLVGPPAVALALADPEATIYLAHATRGRAPIEPELEKVIREIGADD